MSDIYESELTTRVRHQSRLQSWRLPFLYEAGEQLGMPEGAIAVVADQSSDPFELGNQLRRLHIRNLQTRVSTPENQPISVFPEDAIRKYVQGIVSGEFVVVSIETDSTQELGKLWQKLGEIAAEARDAQTSQ